MLSYDESGFGQLFFRRLNLTGHDLFVAPPEAVTAYIRRMAVRKHLPEDQSEGSPWPMRAVLAGWQSGNLLGYEAAAKRARRSSKYIVNLCQRHQFFDFWSEKIHTLLTKTSLLWSMRHERALIPLEHLSAQGINVWGPGCKAGVVRLALAGDLTDVQIRHLSGNSFNIAQVSSLLLFCLCGFENRALACTLQPSPRALVVQGEDDEDSS